MREVEYIAPCGARVIVRDPLEPGTPEWDERMKRWKRALGDYMKSELIRKGEI